MKEELYYFKGDKKEKGKTWLELLQGIYKSLNKPVDERRWVYTAKETIDTFFASYQHNENDGGYWVDGGYKSIRTQKYVQKIGENGQPIAHWELVVTVTNGEWIPSHWKPMEKGWWYEDSFGRIIPSGYIKDCYKLFKPDTSVKKVDHRHWYWHRRGTGTGSRHWCGRRYAGNHGGFGMETHSSIGFVNDLRYDEDLYGLNINYNRARTKWIELAYTDWEVLHWNNKGRGWKRTRKEKQWMRGIKKFIPLPD